MDRITSSILVGSYMDELFENIILNLAACRDCIYVILSHKKFHLANPAGFQAQHVWKRRSSKTQAASKYWPVNPQIVGA